MRTCLMSIFLLAAGCNDPNGGATGDGGPGDGGLPPCGINCPDGPFDPDAGRWVHDGSVFCVYRTCQGHLYQCGDCTDNDNDNLIDSEDPICLGACQNNEQGFFGNIPGQNNAPCKMDCYFDQDTGSGNDQCYWDHQCDPHEVSPGFYPEGPSCSYDINTNFPNSLTCAGLLQEQSQACHQFCGPLTPNGCDCFGCCTIWPETDVNKAVYLGSTLNDDGKTGTCDLARATDPTKCKPCQVVESCFNGCGRCELCLGKTTVPEDCLPPKVPDGGFPDGATPDLTWNAPDMGQCPAAVQPCGLEGQAPCPADYYCITGCCYANIP